MDAWEALQAFRHQYAEQHKDELEFDQSSEDSHELEKNVSRLSKKSVTFMLDDETDKLDSEARIQEAQASNSTDSTDSDKENMPKNSVLDFNMPSSKDLRPENDFQDVEILSETSSDRAVREYAMGLKRSTERRSTCITNEQDEDLMLEMAYLSDTSRGMPCKTKRRVFRRSVLCVFRG